DIWRGTQRGLPVEGGAGFGGEDQERAGVLADVRDGVGRRFDEQSRRARSVRTDGDAENVSKSPFSRRSTYPRDDYDNVSNIGTARSRSARTVAIHARRSRS